MSKCILVVRVSTESQQLDDQKREIIDFARENGFKDDDMILVEALGASAVKLDPKYMAMAQSIKDKILSDKEITTVFVWEMSRLGRNEVILMDFKEFFIKNHIQFICKNPSLILLNLDGSVNGGTELAFSLFATMSVQEVRNKQDRFHRAKKAMSAQGRFTGGRCTKFGYRVGEGGYIEIDEEDAKLVRLVFEMYSTGKWSIKSLYDELSSRGYRINHTLIAKMVADRTYVDGRYPQMISQELFDRCEEVRKKNFIGIPKGNKWCFGSGIFKCPVCGNNMIPDGVQYKCRHHRKYSGPPYCPNGLTSRIENIDGLLWFVAVQEETKYRFRMDADKRKEFKKEIEVMRQKVETAKKNLVSLGEKRTRISELYEEGYISKEDMKKRQNKTLSDEKMYQNTILELEEKIEGFLGALRANENEVPSPEFMKDVYFGVLRESEIKEMDRIVKNQIRTVTTTATEFKGRKSAQMITVETVWSGVRKFIYVARKYNNHYFFTIDGKPLVTVRKIVREPLGELSPKAFKKIR